MTTITNNLLLALALVPGADINGGQVQLPRNAYTFEEAVQLARRERFSAIIECERKTPDNNGHTGCYYLKGKGMTPVQIFAALVFLKAGKRTAYHQRRVWIL